MKAQSEALQALQGQVKDIVEGQRNPRNYISELESRGTASPAANQQQPDFDAMTQQELVQYLGASHNAQLQNMASQFGELLHLVAPQWDGWKMQNAIYGLMSRGLSPMQAYEAVKKEATASTPATGQADVTKEAGKDNNGDADFQAAVDKRAQEIAAQQRSSRAGTAGKPARNDATAPALTPRELHKQMYDRLVVQGETIPENFTRGL